MKPNLDTLKTEIEQYLEEAGLSVFHGYMRTIESTPAVYWDCVRYPDYKLFVNAARAAGMKLIVLHQRVFEAGQLDDALQELADCGLPHQDYREFERRLNSMRIYDGFICGIELSFDYEGRVFLFDLRTEWYEELSAILDEIQFMSPEEDDDDTPMSGYYSKN